MPALTTSSAGFSSTSASSLFWIVRYGASVSQDLQLSSVPRGAEILRDGSLRLDMAGPVVACWRGLSHRGAGAPLLRSGRGVGVRGLWGARGRGCGARAGTSPGASRLTPPLPRGEPVGNALLYPPP